METSNIQHPTPNIQWVDGAHFSNWALDVGCWMFDVPKK
jgi:hypothetical protein